MSTGTGIPMTCCHCGRPIAGNAVGIQGYMYHYECTRGPSMPLQYQHPAPHAAGAMPLPTLTEADVRRIVREELARAQTPNVLVRRAQQVHGITGASNRRGLLGLAST